MSRDNFPSTMHLAITGACQEDDLLLGGTSCGFTQHLAAIYFCLTLFMGSVIFMTLVQAIIIEDYGQNHGYFLQWEALVRRKALLAAFLLTDEDGDGSIGHDELLKLLQAMRPSIERPPLGIAHKIFNTLDAFNCDERISLAEFCDERRGALYVFRDPAFDVWDTAWYMRLLRKRSRVVNRFVRWPYSEDLNDLNISRQRAIMEGTGSILLHRDYSLSSHAEYYAAMLGQPLFESFNMLVLILYMVVLVARLLGDWDTSMETALDDADVVFLGVFSLEVRPQ
eukprot:5490990-Prymnesium_polylepis.2